jgi:N,N'-diacetyllegionaminate synthase
MSVYIIAEIGINHEGNLRKAINMIAQAKKAGADAVKFQLFNPNTLSSKDSKKTKEQKKKIRKETLHDMWQRVKLTEKDLVKLKKFSNKIKIDFFCSIFDFESLDIFKRNKINRIKIASSDITDFPLLKKISNLNKVIYLSTGMADKAEINSAINILGKNKLTLMHCVSLYPCPPEKCNLNRMIELKKRFNVKVGFSDHTIGVESCISAIAMGASTIEKHFTYDKKAKGADHEISADFKELKVIVDFSKRFELIKGNGKITPSTAELKMKKFFRKSIYYKKNVNKFSKISKENIIIRRPHSGLDPVIYNKVLNKKARKKLMKNNPVKLSDIS